MVSRGRTTLVARVGIVAVWVAILVVWVWVVARTTPHMRWPGNYDYSFFTAIAERVRAGDRLYVDVWDNKDPLVFYLIALARSWGVAGAWLLELLWVALTSLGVQLLGRSFGLPRPLVALAAWALAPIIVLGEVYFMGNTHVPGVALVVLAAALVVRGNGLVAGVLLGVLPFVKFVMWPMGLVVALVALLVSGPIRRLTSILIGLGSALAVLIAVMVVRGEFIAYLDAQVMNIRYSQSPIVSAAYTGLDQKIGQHIVVLLNPHVLAGLITSVLILIAAGFVLRHTLRHRPRDPVAGLWYVTTASFLMAVLTIAVTGKWLHHAEVLAASSVLIILVLIALLSCALRVPAIVTALCACAVTIPLAGGPVIAQGLDQLKAVPVTLSEARQTDPASTVLAGIPAGRVAFVGQGNLVPRSGTLHQWAIACRHIAQRPFNPEATFTETLACLPSAEIVVVTADFGPDPEFPAYTGFVTSVEDLLRTDFECVARDQFRVCRRTTSN